MRVGEVLAARFVIERPVGGGGMGAVFLATDRADGGPVAVKVMDCATGDLERFRREARLLAELSHPALVRYVAHGQSEAGEHFIVMQWLEGQDLAQRLSAGGLTVAEGLAVIRRAAAGLAAMHARGIVHRDIKPSNLMLVDGDPHRTKVLDFGIARDSWQTQAMTRTGTLLGTVGYMAPEQARGEILIDPRADVFALGCVLFECLTGRPTFTGRHAVAVLAKVLCEDPPRVSEVRPGLHEELDTFVARLVAKEPGDRPADAASVLDELGALGGFDGTRPPKSRRVLSGLTDAERKVVSVLLGRPKPGGGLSSTSSSEARETPPSPAPGDGGDGESTRKSLPYVVFDDKARVRDLVSRFGGTLTWLDGGAFLVVLSGRGTAVDQAAQAARCALALRRLYPEVSIAVATGRAETLGRLPVGPAIDRAATLLHAAGEPEPGDIVVDDLTSGLLEPRFELRRSQTRTLLVLEQGELESQRLLLGKATPCLGREKELAFLEATLDECAADRVARAALVVAPPGTGKSRLARELVGRVTALDKARLLVARADPVAVGSSLGLAQRLVRYAAGLREGDPPEAQAARLDEYVVGLVSNDSARRLVEFLGELIGAPSDREPSALLRSAREDPSVMSEQKRRAFHAWLAAEVAARPLLVVLEDLHWGDHPTVAYLDDALEYLSDQPIFVVALARPELHEQFPRLWQTHTPHELRLGGLTRRAAERLVRRVLGEGVDDSVAKRIVHLADGNAFYLEELIRQVAEGERDLPETVIAMAESRLERLEPEARRILRAASVFGETFWGGGVSAMVGVGAEPSEWLDTLVDRELLVRLPDSRFPVEREYQFRHALLRDAAYAMLTDDDRVVAHGFAAEWLEDVGETNDRVVAEHFEKGGEPTRAVPWIVRAAKSALDGGDVQAAATLARRGLALGAEGEARGTLLVIRAEALGWDGQFDAALETSREARLLLPTGSAGWWRATASFVAASTLRGTPEEALDVVEALLGSMPDTTQHPIAAARACTWLVLGLFHLGKGTKAAAFLERIGATEEKLRTAEPLYAAWLSVSVAALAVLVTADLGRARRVAERSIATMVEAGDALGEASALCWAGVAAWETGLLDETLAAFGRVRELADVAGGAWLKVYADFYIAAVKLRRGEREGLAETLDALSASTDVSAAQLGHTLMVDLHLHEGRVIEALGEADLAANGPSAATRPAGKAIIAQILLGLGRFGEALDAANRGLAESSAVPPQWLTTLLVVRAEALKGMGDVEGARAAVRQVHRRVLHIAATLDPGPERDAYLTQVSSNARAVALARAWGLEEETKISEKFH